MKLVTIAFCGCVVVAASAAANPPARSPFKCNHVPVRFPDAPEPVYVLDGKAVDRASLERLDQNRVESVAVVCADYVFETFGIKAQRSAIVIFTSPGPRAVLEAAMDSIAGRQAAFVASTGRFATTLDELGWKHDSQLITVKFKLVEDGAGWTATGTHRYLKGNPVVVAGKKRQ